MQIDTILDFFTFSPPVVLFYCAPPGNNPRESITEDLTERAAGLRRCATKTC
jgi:hypothetical protein